MIRRVFQDKLFLLMMGFAAMVFMMLPHLNPPATDDQSEPPGNVIVAIEWPPGNTDVDLWVTGPGEIVPVGYSNKSGLLWNLLRDDLGTSPDATPSNYENAYTRGVLPGEYIVNVHCYRCPILPVPVDVEISIQKEGANGAKEPMKIIATTKVTLHEDHEELTAIRFELTKGGELVPGSMNHVYRELRAANRDEGGDMRGRGRGPGQRYGGR
jgi:hypothetical protein